ncbi:MAG: ribonuclease Z [Planctomycetes bacterium]|nr:ribonuclease Z [Planctomycetota bacterium]
MRVTVLGSGTAVPRPDRFPAGYLVQDAGRNLCIDLGPGVVRRLAQVALDLDDVHAVLLTHYHTDHCADVAALLFGLRNPRYEGRAPLRIVGATGLRALVGHLTAAWPWLAPRGYELELVEIAPGTHDVLGLAVEAIAIEHTAASLGYRVSGSNGAVAAFTGDATWCDALVPLARDADLFVCDSAFPAAAPGPGHMTPAEAGRAASRANARRLVLTHFYPECDGHDLLAEARVEFGGPIVLAKDLMSFELAPGRPPA